MATFPTNGDDTIIGNDVGNTIEALGGRDLVRGLGGNDTIRGHSFLGWLSGAVDGNDTLYGGEGSDLLEGNAGSDRLYGENGNDILRGGGWGWSDAADTLDGGGGNDTLEGNAGSDRLDGGSNNDRLLGHEGNDVLSGGSGIDRFVFMVNSGQEWKNGNDRITDFARGTDIIELKGNLLGSIDWDNNGIFGIGDGRIDATDDHVTTDGNNNLKLYLNEEHSASIVLVGINYLEGISPNSVQIWA